MTAKVADGIAKIDQTYNFLARKGQLNYENYLNAAIPNLMNFAPKMKV